MYACTYIYTQCIYTCKFWYLLGRFDFNDAVIVCQACNEIVCKESPNDLIREGYWPGAAERSSRYIFDQQLFEFYDLLQKHNPGLSEYGFLQTLRHLSEMKGRVRNL